MMKKLLSTEVLVLVLFVVFIHFSNAPVPIQPHKDRMPIPPHDVIHSHYKLMYQHIKFIIMPGPAVFYEYAPLGSAIGISKRQLVCCAHEVDNKEQHIAIDVYNDNGSFDRRIEASIDSINEDKDLCLISAKEDIPYFVDINQSKNIKVGDWVYAIGSSLGQPPFCISHGSYVCKELESCPGMSGSSMAVFSGNSGGGLYDSETNSLIGVVEGGYASQRNIYGCALAISVPIETVREWLKEIENAK